MRLGNIKLRQRVSELSFEMLLAESYLLCMST